MVDGPIQLPQLATADQPLDNVAALGSSIRQIDPFSLPDGQLVPPTMTGARGRGTGQSPPTTEPAPSPSHSAHTPSSNTNDSSTDFAISLINPRPTQGSAVILPRIETHVYLDIGLPSGSWNAIRLPFTKSVTGDDSSSIGEYLKPLLLVIIVRGATTGQVCNYVCERCEKRMGNKIGSPSLIDFHSPSNIITPRRGAIQVHFTFSCYSRHHRKEDNEYVYVAVA